MCTIRNGLIAGSLSMFLGMGAGTEAYSAPFDPNDPIASGYTLVFDEEFTGTSLDQSKWTPTWAWGTGFSKTFPDDESLPDNITINNGAANFAVTLGPTPGSRTYGTSVATTYTKFFQKFGYWEASVKMPRNARGLWSTFWLLPEDRSWPPEIDIIEWMGIHPNTDYMTLHWDDNDTKQFGGIYTGPDFSAGYHKAGLLWTSRSLTWYVDGTARATTSTRVPTKPMYLILKNSTGGWDSNAIDSTTILPAVFSIDYVKVYRPPQ